MPFLNDKSKVGLNELSGLAELKEVFANSQEKAIKEVYRCFRGPFMRFAQTYSKDEQLLIDGFQESVIGLFENLAHNRITEHKSSVKTYLFAIGKNKIINLVNHSFKQVSIDKRRLVDDNVDHELITQFTDQLNSAFSKLGDPCKNILVKFYYERYSIEAIALDLDYKNENTVKAHKSRCMKNLRQIFHKISS